ncbi:MAG: LolA family protein [Planctomycetota bacterium]|jgi:outer membrane lipoprotein-sorting protein
MTHRDDKRPTDALDRATEALREAPVPEGPPGRLVASTVEALQSLEPPPDPVRMNERRKRMLRITRYVGACAAAALLVGLILWLPGRGSALAEVIAKVKSAQSVRFVAHQQLGGPPTVSLKMAFQGHAARMEMPGYFVLVADFQEKSVLQLYLDKKRAFRYEMDEEAAKGFSSMFKNPIDNFAKLTDDDGEKTGESELDGRKVDVYRLKKFWDIELNEAVDRGAIRAWVDQESGLPVRIAIRASFHVDGKSNDWIVMEKFTWNEPLDAGLFRLDVPEGFTLIEGEPTPETLAPAGRPGAAPPGVKEDPSAAARAVEIDFAGVVERAVTAESVTCLVSSNLGEQHTVAARLRARADAVHRETAGIVIEIADFARRKAIRLLPAPEEAYRWDLDEQRSTYVSRRFPNPVLLFREIEDRHAAKPRADRLEGRTVAVYTFEQIDVGSLLDGLVTPREGKLLVFVDPQTKLPVEIRLNCNAPGEEKIDVWLRWENVEWNKPLDANLFQLEVPAGYTIIDGPPPPGPPGPNVDQLLGTEKPDGE